MAKQDMIYSGHERSIIKETKKVQNLPVLPNS